MSDMAFPGGLQVAPDVSFGLEMLRTMPQAGPARLFAMARQTLCMNGRQLLWCGSRYTCDLVAGSPGSRVQPFGQQEMHAVSAQHVRRVAVVLVR
jgi:hypothetical protein